MSFFDAFEELLHLPDCLITPATEEPGKRSLTAQEAELLHLANTFLPRGSATLKRQRDFRRAIARWLDKNSAEPNGSRFALPADAVELARHRSTDMVTDLQSRRPRIRVFGELDELLKTSSYPSGDAHPPGSIRTTLATQWLALGIGAGSK